MLARLQEWPGSGFTRNARQRNTGRRGTIGKLFYYAHLTIRAEWANGVFWTPTSKGPVVIPDPDHAADLVADHVEYSLGLIRKTNARTDPASYTVSGYAEAYYGDGRQAALFLEEVRTARPDDLVRRVRSWAGEQFPKLAEIESDDM